MPVFVGDGTTGVEARSDRLGLPTGTTDPATANAGDTYYKTDTGKIRYYNGTTWSDLGSGASGGGSSSAPVFTNSLRFTSSESNSLNRTNAANATSGAGTYTFSCWIKRCSFGTEQGIFSVRDSGGGGAIQIYFTANDQIRWFESPSADFTTVAKFRDPTAWIHLVFVKNGSTRESIYVNGVETDFLTSNLTSTSIASNNGSVIRIGATELLPSGTTFYANMYITGIHFISGQALLPSAFGATSSTTGSWDPIAYTGTYGNIGYKLSMSTSSVGTDTSGNNLNFSENGFTTTGVDTDYFYDSPSNGGTDSGLGAQVSGNYAVLNPLTSGFGGTLTQGNLHYNLGAAAVRAEATISVISYKWHWEAYAVSGTTNGTVGGRFGFCIPHGQSNPETTKFGLHWHSTSGLQRVVNGTFTSVLTGTNYGDTDTLGCSLDADANIAYFYKNGVLAYTYDFSSFVPVGSDRLVPHAWNSSSGTPIWKYNFGQRVFTHPARTGHKCLVSSNLPEPYYPNPVDAVGALIWTGTGAGGNRTIGSDPSYMNFTPDLIWSKSYEGETYHNQMYDVLRGFTSSAGGVGALVTDQTYTEGFAVGGYVSAVDNGLITYSQEGGGTGYEWYNQNTSHKYIARCWDAGTSTTNSYQPSGATLACNYRANTNAGFSIISYTGPAGTSDHYVGHGLLKAPEFIIVKNRDTTFNWDIYHKELSDTESFVFSNAAPRTVGAFRNQDPTSLLIPLKDDFTTKAGNAYIAYAWHSVDGLSSFGSYLGNSSANGPYYHCGFRPQLIIVKGAGGGQQWFIHDDSRIPERTDGNPSTKEMAWETAQVQYDTVGVGAGERFDILANGFKVRSSNAACNTSGIKYCVMAWARSPLKYARAR